MRYIQGVLKFQDALDIFKLRVFNGIALNASSSTLSRKQIYFIPNGFKIVTKKNCRPPAFLLFIQIFYFIPQVMEVVFILVTVSYSRRLSLIFFLLLGLSWSLDSLSKLRGGQGKEGEGNHPRPVSLLHDGLHIFLQATRLLSLQPEILAKN